MMNCSPVLAVDKEIVSLVDHYLFSQTVIYFLRILPIGIAMLNVYFRANEIEWL